MKHTALLALYRVYKLLISLKLAVVTISLLAVLTGLGTVIESRYDQETANKLIYGSPWMTAALCLLALSLTLVLIDRWPWKKRHIGFVTAHIGLLILISGSFLTRLRAVDGSIRLKEGKSASKLTVSDMEIKIYSSYDGENFSLIHEQPVDMFFVRPNETKPYIVASGGGGDFVVDRYFPFALGRAVFRPAPKGPPAVRWQLEGSKASVVEWMRLERGENILSKDFGPARLSLTTDENYRPRKERELVLLSKKGRLLYSLGKSGKKRFLKKGEILPTGWMDLKFRLLEFFPQSQREFVFSKKNRPSDFTIKALRVRRKGRSSWIGQNSYIRFFEKDRVYVFGYLNKAVDLGFDLKLVDFRMIRYPGSSQAKEYESDVVVEGLKRLISMNKPFKHRGWTVYQSGFEDEPQGGEPVVSVFSVNRDPGRPLKYTGSALVTAGIVLLFYRRKIPKQGFVGKKP